MSKPVLSLRGIRRAFGGEPVLEQVNLDLQAGEVAALVGPNGSGKTTLFNIIGRLDRPDAGDVLLFGESILDRRPDELASLGLARVFQHSAPWEGWTVRDRLATGRFAVTSLQRLASSSTLRPPAHPEDALQAMAVQAFGLEGLMRARLDRLPYRDRRYVEFASALGSRPRILVLDEPTAGLSPEEREPVRLVLRSLVRAGVAVLLVEHDLDFVAAVADRCVLLGRGRVLVDGPTATVLASPELRQTYGDDREGRA